MVLQLLCVPKKAKMTPREIIDKYHELNKKTFKNFGISFDIYHRTSSKLHHELSSDFFKKLSDKGIFSIKESEQYFDEEFQQFLADRYIKGECPKCHHENSYGDQCENCGSDLSPTDLINPKSTLSGRKPVLKKTKHWYLPMQNYQEWVSGWIENQQEKEKWKKHVVGQCRSWVLDGLQERAMTRDLDWGVKVPLPDAKGKVLYVWLDAPIGYISATKALTKDWELYWKSDDTKLVHFIGKDNIVFHCIIFPILLHAHGDYILPTNIPANQFMNLENTKVSTSRNHAVWIHEYLEAFPDKKNALRYALITNMPENRDSDFSWNDFKKRNNSELVGLLGGFIHRTLTLIHKHFDGELPPMNNEHILIEDRKKIYGGLTTFRTTLHDNIHSYQFRNGMNTVLGVARLGNKFLNDMKPWEAVKTNKSLASEILSICLDIILVLSVYLEPFLPDAAEKLKEYLKLDPNDVERILSANYNINVKKLDKPNHFFQRIEQEMIDQQIEKLGRNNDFAKTDKNIIPMKETITLDVFDKIDIRTATIIEAVEITGSKKLLKIKVDIGNEVRTIVSGIGKQYGVKELLSKKVLVLINLEHKKIHNIKSQGMLLMIKDRVNDSFKFISAEEQDRDGDRVV